MLINSAWAAANETTSTIATTGTQSTAGAPQDVPSAGEAFAMNMALVLVMVALFYLLLIRPQQKRFKEHANMLNRLEKGTKIVTQGGLVGVIEKEISEHELLIDFGNNVKIAAMRSAIMGRYEDALPKSKPANDDKKSKAQDKAAK
jgi:preprotein translocase subunit YajC